MTEKTVIECDGPDWENCKGEHPVGEVPHDWSTFDTPDGEFHFCPPCTEYGRGLLTGGKSVGPLLKVSHNYLGKDFEEAHVHAGTHGMHISQAIDEPPYSFDYDPPLGADDSDIEAWGFHVFDHLHVAIIGQHKEEPRVVVKSDEWPVNLEVHDPEDSFDGIEVDKNVEEVKWLDD